MKKTNHSLVQLTIATLNDKKKSTQSKHSFTQNLSTTFCKLSKQAFKIERKRISARYVL